MQLSASVRYTVIEKKQNRDRKPQQKNELHRRLRSICTKLDESNEEAGIGIAVGDDTISDFTVNNYVALKLNIRRGTLILSVPLGYRLFFRLGVFRLKALMSFPISSSAGLDGNSPQVSEDLTAKSNGRTGLKFFTLNKSCEFDSRSKGASRQYFFGANLENTCAKKYRWRTLSSRSSQYFPSVERDSMFSNHVKQDTEVDK